MAPEVSAVAFDLGGVLLQLGDPAETFGIGGDVAAFHERWTLAESVRTLERGEITVAEFSRVVVDELELDMGAEEFRRRFDAWPERLFPGALDLLDRIPANLGRYLLSNINADHWNRDYIAGVLQARFDHAFLSYETGLVKPDREAYEQVIDAANCAPAAIIYVDDNAMNVRAAAETGMQAHVARGIAGVTQVLARAGIWGRTSSTS